MFNPDPTLASICLQEQKLPGNRVSSTATFESDTLGADMDEIDDAELQELAEADMSQHTSASQQQPEQAHEQALQLPHSSNKPEQPQADQHVPDNGRIHEGAPEEDILLEDDELIELACASLSEEPLRLSDNAEHPANGIGNSAAPMTDTLDDEELLALANTQLDEA